VPATAAVGAAVVAWQRDSRWWLIAAATLGGSAMLMKQSGFDGLAVVFAVALLRQERLKSVALVAAGAAVPLGASAIAGWFSGWRSYWSAVVGDHVGAATAASRPAHLLASLPAAARDLLPLAAVALVGLWLSRKQPLQLRLGLIWLAAALVGSTSAVSTGPTTTWAHPLQAIPGALTSLERTLASPRRPRLVVLFQRNPLRRHRLLRAIVDRYYREIWRAPGTGTPVLASLGRSLG